jgi:hypothetical protein
MAASLAMTRDVVVCLARRTAPGRLETNERAQIEKYSCRQDSRPMGVVHARDILQVLLEESEDEESMLRDYVMGIGY